MEKYIFIFLVFWGFKVIAIKYSLQEKIGTLSMKWRSRFLHEISECAFCFEHHLAIIPVLISILFFQITWIDIFTPVMVAAMSNILKK